MLSGLIEAFDKLIREEVETIASDIADEKIANLDVDQLVDGVVTSRLDEITSDLRREIDQEFDKKLDDLAEDLRGALEKDVTTAIEEKARLMLEDKGHPIHKLIEQVIKDHLTQMLLLGLNTRPA